MIAAAILGAALTLALGAPRPAASEVREMASVRAATRAAESASASAELLEAARGLRDEAEALTSAEVALDASLMDVWLPRLAELEAMIADPATPPAIRAELEATVEALARVGLR